MASVKVAQLRKTLEAFASLYEGAAVADKAQALRSLGAAMAGADKRTVDDLVKMLSTSSEQVPAAPSLRSKN